MLTFVVVVAAGPVGLAAAHLVERGLEPLVPEAGPSAGTAVRDWAHVRLFSPWSEVTDPAAEKLLAPTGWTRPYGASCPTGGDWAERYLQPLAAAQGGDAGGCCAAPATLRIGIGAPGSSGGC